MEEGTESTWMKPMKNVLQTQELQTSAGMSIVQNKNAQNIDTYGSFFLIYIHLIKATHVCVKLNTFVLQNGWPKMMESIL